MGSSGFIAATEVGSAGDGVSSAAALAVALARGEEGVGVVLAEVGATSRRRPTLLSSAPARELEERLSAAGFAHPAARGRICWLGLELKESWRECLRDVVAAVPGCLIVAHLPATQWRAALGDTELAPVGALIRADVRAHRDLLALAVAELLDRGLTVRVATRPLGLVGARRALAGLDPGGRANARLARMARALQPQRRRPREAGQALPLVLGGAFATILVALAMAALGGAVTATARGQRAADLAALSAARSMRDDAPRLLAPGRRPDGSPNPAHLDRAQYLARAEAVAREAASRNEVAVRRVRVSFPDADSLPPLRVRVELAGERRLWAEAQAAPPAGPVTPPTTASGGGYEGPLEYRQGKPMRPDVAAALDRLAAAAARDDVPLLITSAYRSDAEQARLFAQNPDPRWVAPPGTSLHRCATELDLGPAAAYGWLAANAPRFGFLKRYSWEPWHFGFTRGPAPCAAVPAGGIRRAADGDEPAALPAFVPVRYRAALTRAASRWSVSAGLLAAQLEAESGFDPAAVSPAGARGIAQFMPGTAAAYGLRDPFDPAAAIDAQAHLMSDLLEQFGSIPLALAAYNAGPAPVAACNCVPPYPETEAYVARILALIGGAGGLVPELEVRLVA